MSIEDLLDRHAVRDCVTKYAVAIDSRDWDALGAVIAPQITLDFGDFTDQPPLTVSRDGFVAHARQSLGGFTATQHLSLNDLTEVSGDSASVQAIMSAHHLLRSGNVDEVLILRGFYDIGLERTDTGWQINCYAVRVTWVDGDLGLLQRAASS